MSEHSAHSLLLKLPDELLAGILRNLDHRSLLRCCSACQTLRKMVANYAEFQYTIELAKDGMSDTGLINIPYTERLSLLWDRRRAWDTSHWKRRSVTPMHTAICRAYELVAGLFVNCDGDKFSLSWLPSAVTDGWQRLCQDPGIIARDFAIDPTQDLIVFLEEGLPVPQAAEGLHICIHIRSMSFHEPHPSARSPVLQFFIPSFLSADNSMETVILQLVDDIVAVFTKIGQWRKRLLIWNWKDGSLICDLDEDNLPDQAWDFSFISPRAYILTSCGGSGSIEIFSFVSMPSYRPAHRATLRLPQLQYLSYINHLLTHTAPFMGRPAFPHTSFTTSPDSRIHVLSARYSNPFEHTYTMFVHNRTFLAYASDPRGTQRRDVHWDAWGEHNTRFWNRRISNNWMRYVYGQKVVCSPLRGEATSVEVLDFNVCPLHDDAEGGVSELPELVFEKPVITHLPYRSSIYTFPEAHPAYLIDEDRIIGLRTDFLGGCIEDLYVYSF